MNKPIMNIYDYEKLTKEQIKNLCDRDNILSENVISAINHIQSQIKQKGDLALKELTYKFDGATLNDFKVSTKEFQKANSLVPQELKNAIKIAKENIWKFHEEQFKQGQFKQINPKQSLLQESQSKESQIKENHTTTSHPAQNTQKIQTSQGVFCWREFRAIESVGLYVPAGSAPLFSTLLMLAIPALIAKCRQIIICTPPNKNAQIAPEILWSANFLGITEVYKIGGAQAIFALAQGTKQIPKVHKIFGPGNKYVTAAKIKVSSFVAIDMPAGPSEVLVIAQKNSNASFVASDLLSQAEHDKASKSILVCDEPKKIDEILSQVQTQLQDLPRKDIAKEALKNSFAILTKDIKSAFDFSNTYAPEHLILSFEDYEKYLPYIQNAGSVFCGKYSCESFGDYASGTNHVLPTNAFAKSYSGLGAQSFGKWITFQSITQKGLKNLGESVEIMSSFEKLEAHKNAITIRKKHLIKENL